MCPFIANMIFINFAEPSKRKEEEKRERKKERAKRKEEKRKRDLEELAKAFEKWLGATSKEGKEASSTSKKRRVEYEASTLVPSPAPTPAPNTPQAPTKVPVSNASSSSRPTSLPPPAPVLHCPANEFFHEQICNNLRRLTDMSNWTTGIADLSEIARHHLCQAILLTQQVEERSTAYKTKIYAMKNRIEEMKRGRQLLLTTTEEQAAENKRLEERFAREEEKRGAVESALAAATAAQRQMAKSLEKGAELRNKLFREALVSSVAKKQAFQRGLELFEHALERASERIGSDKDVFGALRAEAQDMHNNPPSFKSGESVDEEPGVEVSSRHGSTTT